MKEISSRTERFGAIAGFMFSDTRDGIRFGCLFWYLNSPHGGEPKMYVQAKAKDFRGHYTEHDLLTPQPLVSKRFFFSFLAL